LGYISQLFKHFLRCISECRVSGAFRPGFFYHFSAGFGAPSRNSVLVNRTETEILVNKKILDLLEDIFYIYLLVYFEENFACGGPF
jgi:hypothetical protein